MNKDQIIEKIKKYGVVGAGGAGFPTHIKLDAKVDYVLANGLECEPLLYNDQELMTYYPRVILTGLQLTMNAVSAKKGIIVLKKKYKNPIKILKKHIKNYKNIELKLVENYYPAGDEQSLVYEILKRIVPEGGLPLDVGVLVQNVCTLYNIYSAMIDIPVVDRFVTITGEVKKPGVYCVSIGTPIKDILNYTKIKINNFKVLQNGPLMGSVVNYDSEVITKTTSALIVLPDSHLLIRKKEENVNKSIKKAKSLCIQCNTCTLNCPRNSLGHNLKPHLLMRKISLGDKFIDESYTDSLLCCECSICSYYACPMDLLPHKVIQFIKSKIKEKNIKSNFNNKNPESHPLYKTKKIPTNKLIKRLNLSKYINIKPSMINKRYDSKYVRIRFNQHIGKTAGPIIKKGDKVKRFQLIADIKNNETGANIHSSIDGIAVNITQNFVEIKK